MSARSAFRYFWLPGLLIATYVGLRLLGFQPGTDLVGMSAVLRVGFLVAAAAVAYLIPLLPSPEEPAGGRRPASDRRFWNAACLLLVLLAADDAFMIHETVSWNLEVPEVVVFALYGALLVLLVATHHQRLTPTFFAFLGGFALLSAIAVAADTLSGKEGVLWVAGFGLDYEQICEMFACLSLAAAFWHQALTEIAARMEAPVGAPKRQRPRGAPAGRARPALSDPVTALRGSGG